MLRKPELKNRTPEERKRMHRTVAAIVAFVAFLAVACFLVGGPLLRFIDDPEKFRAWVNTHGIWGRIAFVGMMVLQIVIAFIPGEPLEIAAGYAFGAVEGTLLSIAGAAIGFMGVANLLAFVLEKYPAPSVCLFVGLIAGMLPSLWREAGGQGRSKGSYYSLTMAMALVFALLIWLNTSSIVITPNFIWYLFCGFCLALSVIAPGMSFSTLLMPLGLYTPFVDGIGHLSMEVLIPAGIGGLITIICLSRAVNMLFDKYYSLAFHAILGIVIAATVMIIPFESFTVSLTSALINVFFLAAGIFAATVLDQFNSKVEVA